MPLLIEQANLLSQEDLLRGVIEEIVDVDELFALFPFTQTEGKAYVYNRELDLSEPAWLNPYDIVPEGAAKFTEVTTQLRILAGDIDLDKFILATRSDHNNQLAIQLASKAKGMGRAFRRALIQGSSAAAPTSPSTAPSIDGLAALTPAEQTILTGANGGPLTLSMLDQLRDLVKLGADCFMMNRQTWRGIKAQLRTFNGNTGDMIEIENFGRPIKSFDGTPVILNDYIPANETVGTNAKTTSIYALRLNEADGFHGLHAPGMGGGMQWEEIGTIQNKDAVRYRVKWYVGTALKSTLSVARLAGVNSVG